MLETFAEVFVQATQPRSAHTAVYAVERAGLGGIDELAARLGHRRSVGAWALIENQAGRNLGSDLSDGWVSTFVGGWVSTFVGDVRGWVSTFVSSRWVSNVSSTFHFGYWCPRFVSVALKCPCAM